VSENCGNRDELLRDRNEEKKKQSDVTCGAGAAAGASESLGASDFCSD